MSDAKREAVDAWLTEDRVLVAMCPTGATMKYGAIVAQVADQSGLPHHGHEFYRAVDKMLQRMKKIGRVELVKGAGGGWKLSDSERAARGATP